MRVAVVGLGGVGGYIAAMLAKSGVDVSGFARGTHLKKIQQNGLKVIEDERSWRVDIDAKELEEAEGYFDIVLFCVKSYDLEDVCTQILNHTDSDTIMISFSNGVSNAQKLTKLSDAVVLEGVVYILSHIEEAGVIRKKGKVFAAVFGGDDKAADTLKEIFDQANLRTKIPKDIKTALWKKYIFISAFATLTSYYDKSIGYVYEHHRDEAYEVLKEIVDVAHAKGIEISEEIDKSLDVASKVPYESSTSMHLDFQKGKRAEIETLSGYVVQEAQKYNIQVPLMYKMYDKLL